MIAMVRFNFRCSHLGFKNIIRLILMISTLNSNPVIIAGRIHPIISGSVILY